MAIDPISSNHRQKNFANEDHGLQILNGLNNQDLKEYESDKSNKN